MKQTDAYREVLEFLNWFVEYHLQIPEDYVDEDGRPSTAAELQKCLKLLPKELPKRHRKSAATSKPVVKKEKMSYEDWLNNPDFKDYLYTVRKLERESVNPHWKYCVLDDDLTECWVTDDIGKAMEFAAARSKYLENSYSYIRVCRIVQNTNDGTWQLVIDHYYNNGKYTDNTSTCTFLHFDYIVQCCGEIHKIL